MESRAVGGLQNVERVVDALQKLMERVVVGLLKRRMSGGWVSKNGLRGVR